MTPDIKRGDRVRIRKGAEIKSTHPSKPVRTAKRAQTVTVHMVWTPWRVSVGRRTYTEEGVLEHEYLGYTVSRHDPARVAEVHGTSELENLREHIIEDFAHTRNDGKRYCSLFLQVAPAKVSWAGSGGYWCDVALDQVEKVADAETSED